MLWTNSSIVQTHNLRYAKCIIDYSSFMPLCDKRVERENKLLLKELPYYGCKDLASAHLQFNNLLTSALSRNQLDQFKSLFDLDLFNLNVPTVQQVKVSISVHSHFRCKYFSPHNFFRQKHRLAQSDNLSLSSVIILEVLARLLKTSRIIYSMSLILISV